MSWIQAQVNEQGQRLCTVLNRTSLRAKVGAAIGHYNKYRSPEVNAKLLNVGNKYNRFVVLFAGSFCRTCGFYDYFEDLVYDLLDESSIKAKITKVKEEWETENFKVTFEVEDTDPSRTQ